jgi:site-specific DNA-methyltransferase (adenine-specific)
MDCLKGMQLLEEKSIDMILCDLPYGVTDCKWDSIIPLNLLWEQYNRIIKDNGAIVLFAVQPFTTKLIHSNKKYFRYCWYWKKNNVTGGTFAKVQPMRCVEDICVFYKKMPAYNPQGLVKLEKPIINKVNDKTDVYTYEGKYSVQKYTNYPKHLIEFKRDKERLHPTQKPVALCEYLIKTYTNAGDLVLDNCAGSGTTLKACKNTKRNFIGFEMDKHYYNVALERLAA